ncbi:MAG: hypothetical protein ACLQBJ_03875 [Bryobacteraceae bacterium]
MLRIPFTLVYALALLAAGAGAQSAPTELRLTIQLDKSTYKAGEPIRCLILLKNAGDGYVMVNSRLLVNQTTGPHELYVWIQDPERNTVGFTTKVRASSESTEFSQLLPNQIVGLEYDLTKDHDLGAVGSYTVRVYYENHTPTPAGSPLPAWQGNVESNRLTFTIQ